MPVETSLRGAEKNVQDWISLVCGALLFISPWALGFVGDLAAARTAWVGGIVIAALAIAALVQFAEWEEWVTLVVGLGGGCRAMGVRLRRLAPCACRLRRARTDCRLGLGHGDLVCAQFRGHRQALSREAAGRIACQAERSALSFVGRGLRLP